MAAIFIIIFVCTVLRGVCRLSEEIQRERVKRQRMKAAQERAAAAAEKRLQAELNRQARKAEKLRQEQQRQRRQQERQRRAIEQLQERQRKTEERLLELECKALTAQREIAFYEPMRDKKQAAYDAGSKFLKAERITAQDYNNIINLFGSTDINDKQLEKLGKELLTIDNKLSRDYYIVDKYNRMREAASA